MKKLLGLLGTILITSNAAGPLVVNKPVINKIKSSLETLNRCKRQAPSSKKAKKTISKQSTQRSANKDSQADKIEFIEKEISLDENYSENIQKILKELSKNGQLDLLRMINNEETSRIDYFKTIDRYNEWEANIKIIEKLDLILKLKNFDTNKFRILILTVKNKDKSIKLAINLANFYLLGFINENNNNKQYFYFENEANDQIAILLDKIDKAIQIKKLIKEWKNKAINIEKISELKNQLYQLQTDLKQEYINLKPLIDKQLKFNQTPLPNKIKSNQNFLQKIATKIKNLNKLKLEKQSKITIQINEAIEKKYNCQKISLRYTGAYSEKALNAVIKMNSQAIEARNIVISQNTLNKAISNLATINNKNIQNQAIKDDLIRMIFITSETMRFAYYRRSFNYEYKIIDQKIKFKNILVDVQKIINDCEKMINWKTYEPQLIGGWKISNQLLETRRKKIFKKIANEVNYLELVKTFFSNSNEFKKINWILKLNKLKLWNFFSKNINTFFSNLCNKNIDDQFIWEIYNISEEKIKQLEDFIKTKMQSNFKNLNQKELMIKQQELYNIFKSKIKVILLEQIKIFLDNEKLINMEFNLFYKIKDINFQIILLLNSLITTNSINILEILIQRNPKLILDTAIAENYIETINLLRKYDSKTTNGEAKTKQLNDNALYNTGFFNLNPINVSEKIVNFNKNKNDDTSLLCIVSMYLKQNDHKNLAKELINSYDFLIKSNSNDVTYLHIAIFEGNLDIAEFLITSIGINVNAKTKKYNVAPLHIAVDKNHIDAIKFLLDQGADINAQDKNGLTPLHMAVDKNHINATKILLDHDANISMQDKNGLKPIHLAIHNQYNEIIDLLLEYLSNLLEQNKTNIIAEIDSEKIANSPQINLSSTKNNVNETSYSPDPMKTSERKATINDSFEKLDDGDLDLIADDVLLLLLSNNELIASKANFESTNNMHDNKKYDVPADGSCLFWSVATAYLLPVRHNNEEFKNRFTQLFGRLQLSHSSYIQNLLQQFDLTNFSSTQTLYQDTRANHLISNVLRNRIVDYIQNNLHRPIQRNLDGSQAETFEEAINQTNIIENSEFSINDYLERARISNEWGGQIEILAIGNMLNVNINESNQNIFTTNNANESIQIFHVESEVGSDVKNHYNFSLVAENNDLNSASQELNTIFTEQIDITRKRKLLKQQKAEKKKIKIIDDHFEHHQSIKKNHDDDEPNAGASGNNFIGFINNGNLNAFANEQTTNNNQQKNSSSRQLNTHSVPSSNTCLLWSVATAYLLPVKDNYIEFRNKFIQLFGEEQLTYLAYVQNLLQQFNLTNYSSTQKWYQDINITLLVTNIFRNRVINYIQDNLDSSAQKNYDATQAETFETIIDKISTSENSEFSANDYLEKMRNPNTNFWEIQILAIARMLNTKKLFIEESRQKESIQILNVKSQKDYDIKNHYKFALATGNIGTDEKTKEIIDNHDLIANNFNIPSSKRKIIEKYNALSKVEKQQKLNEVNNHYQRLSENDKQIFKDKLKAVGISAIGSGISAIGTKITISSATAQAATEAELVTVEALSIAEGTVIEAEVGTAAALAPETLGLSLVIGGLAIAGTAIIWWITSDHTTATKNESHNQYNQIEKWYKFLSHDQLKLNISSAKWSNIKQIYQSNLNNYQEFKNKIKLEITNFDKEDHSGWGGEITDDDINTLIKTLFNHFQEINNYFASNSNHGWKIVTNTINNYFMIEKE